MKNKNASRLAYIAAAIISFLVIPDVIIRVLSPEQLASVSDIISLDGLLNPLFSLLVFMGLFSIIVAIGLVVVARRFIAMVRNHKSSN